MRGFFIKRMKQNEKKKIGRPRIIQSPDEMIAMAEAYFAQCQMSEQPITLAGMCYALGLTSRKSLDEYAKRDEFTGSVNRLKLRIEAEYESRLHASGNASGAIFALKNFGWRDKVEVEHDGNINLSLAQSIEAGRQRVAAAQCAPDDDEQS